MPVEILGLDGTPDPGRALRRGGERGPRPRAHRLPHPAEAREGRRARSQGASLADMMAKLQPTRRSRELPVIIKADVQGSAEAIVGSLDKLAHRRGARADHPFGRRRDQRKRRHAGQGRRLADPRLQRPRLEAGARPGRARRRGDPLLRDHLRPDRRHQRRALGHAGADPARNLPRQRRGAAGLRHLQGRPGRRLPGHRGRGPQGRPGPDHPRGRRGAGTGHPADAQALQGRGQRGPVRPGMRHGLRRASRTSRPATSSSASPSKRSSGRCSAGGGLAPRPYVLILSIYAHGAHIMLSRFLATVADPQGGGVSPDGSPAP